jgi:hypothetical protein
VEKTYLISSNFSEVNKIHADRDPHGPSAIDRGSGEE